MRRYVITFSSMAWCCFVQADTARIGAYVLDAVTQKPISGIKVFSSFSNDNGWKAWTESAPVYHDEQITDENGFCVMKGKSNIGRAGCYVRRQGAEYYGGCGQDFNFTSKNIFGVWQPDNLVATILLQRVEHPIPLSVRNVRLRSKEKLGIQGFDGTNMVLRFDFLIGDWLPPHGSGKQADMIIKTQYVLNGVWPNKYLPFVFYDFENTIEFPGRGNGLCERMFDYKRLGIKFREAVEDGYVHEKKLCFGCRKHVLGPNVFGKEYTDCNEYRCYCFRIRSRFNERGEMIAAYYGKVYGDFIFHGASEKGLSYVEFQYYLNTKVLDRNLEWDMNNNLCPSPGHVRMEP